MAGALELYNGLYRLRAGELLLVNEDQMHLGEPALEKVIEKAERVFGCGFATDLQETLLGASTHVGADQ